MALEGSNCHNGQSSSRTIGKNARASMKMQLEQLRFGGGEGSRTPVLEAFDASLYMFSRWKFLGGRTLHRHTAGPRASTKFLHRSARSLRRTISLLSMFPAVAGVQPETSRSIKPRERDLGDLRLFFLVRILTRPTNHPRHAACASNNESKPVRPQFWRRELCRRQS